MFNTINTLKVLYIQIDFNWHLTLTSLKYIQNIYEKYSYIF